MFKDKEKLYQAYHAMLSMTLTWALVLVINQYFHLKVSGIVSLLYSLVPALLIYLFDINKKNLISYLLLISILPILALIFWFTKTNPEVWLQNLINWCTYYDGTKELYAARYAHVVVLGTALLGAIVFYLLTKNQLAKIILAAALMVSMIILSVSQIDINKAVVAIGIFYIMTILVELYGMLYSRKTGKPDKKEGILYLAPICLILSILAIALPSKPEPIEWKAVKFVYNNVKEQIEIWQTDLNYYFGNSRSEFFVSLTGYNEETGKLVKGDKVIKDTKIAMKISGMDKGKTVYLTGSVNDIYTGSSWEKSKQDYLTEEKEYNLDYAELFLALTRQDQTVLENNRFVERRSIRVSYNNIKTKTFFYPLKMSWYDMLSGNSKLNTERPQINFKKARGKGTSYQLTFFEMNLAGDAFQQMLRDADTFSYADYAGQTIDLAAAAYVQNTALYNDRVDGLSDRKDYYDTLGKHADMIEAQYTNLPDNLPDRVYQLAQEITAGYHTKYDKLKAIEQYLLTNYTYTLEPQKVPEGEDFTDYFLFESKKGYCTYYATAMAVLGRCIGVPTRYVEGFLGKFEVRDEEFMYLVKNSQAHAWAEAYIEGVGWIPFEATTPFYGNRYTTWAVWPKSGNGTNSGSGSYSPDFSQGTPPQANQNTEEVVVVTDNNSKEILSGILIFLSAALILLLVLIIYYWILKYRYKKAFEKADYNKKTYMLFLRILKQLRREGFELESQETILMLADRVKDRFHFNTISFPDVADIFMRYRYAEEKMTKEDLEQVNIYCTGLSKKEREEESRLKVWTQEFLFLAKKGNY
ncbi:MAG TPA: transglutaminase-like domain-containing protein [Mobilitalea sp.]|nr:transglutaminase-like domain-containing protein [Mobilitalea sp.]